MHFRFHFRVLLLDDYQDRSNFIIIDIGSVSHALATAMGWPWLSNRSWLSSVTPSDLTSREMGNDDPATVTGVKAAVADFSWAAVLITTDSDLSVTIEQQIVL